MTAVYTRTHSFRVAKIVHAPLPFVYSWCTDYKESDPKITGSKARRRILLKTKHRVIYTSSYRSGGKPKTAVNVVTLYPPKWWHLDFVGDEDDETGEYRLKSLGRGRTKLEMSFTEHYKMRRPPTKAQDVKHTHEVWDKYLSALERDYARRNK